MNWLQILQLIFGLIQQAGPLLTAVGALHTAVNATPGTPEHTAAIEALGTSATSLNKTPPPIT